MRYRYPVVTAFLCVCSMTFAQSGLPVPAPELLRDSWTAHWITDAAAPRNDYAVLLARKTFDLAGKPAKFVVHVSADARYLLKVNGQVVASGPQWGAAPSWRYESIDLAPFAAGRPECHHRPRAQLWRRWSARQHGPETRLHLAGRYGRRARRRHRHGMESVA